MNLQFDLVIGGVPRFDAESAWSSRLVDGFLGLLPCGTRNDLRGLRPTLADAAGHSPLLLVQSDPEAYLLPEAAFRLLVKLGQPGRDVLLPVSNEPWSEEARCAPPFAYHTPSLLEEAVRFVASSTSEAQRAHSPRSPVFAVRREALAGFPPSLPLDALPEEAGKRGRGVFVDSGAYVHRYGAMDGQAREDLASRVPQGARGVLDVGCSRGRTAELLRRRGVLRVVGIEPDPGDAREAAAACDRVLGVPLEEIREDFSGQFDAVLFGDVLEHLVDPLAALARVRPWLSPGGVVVASLPNMGHWAVVGDLLEGRFEYVPYSILSGTHLRFFTRRTVADLFEASGYAIASVETVVFPISPVGAAKLALLRSFPGASPDLAAAEFLVVAKPA